jgi:CheY-like chemotaxis protein
VLEARHADAALELATAATEPIDLLVSDLVMPGLGGRALADRLLGVRPGLRVLFITGYAAEAVERQGRLPAGHGLLEKPFTADQLAHKVREALTAR